MLIGGLAGTCLEIAPDHAEASLGLAILATERGEDELAVAILQQTLGMGNRSAEVYHRLGVALNQWGKLAEAGKVLQTGLDRFPQAAEMWLLLDAISLYPDRPAHYLELAELYAATGRLVDAQRVRRHFADRYPEHVGNQLRLAVLSCELGDLATAEASYRAVLAARPDAASAYAGLAQVYRKARDLKQARRWAEESVRWEPSVAGYQSLAEICHELGDRRSAQAARMEADRLRGKAGDGP